MTTHYIPRGIPTVTEDTTDLARRAVTTPHWRWLPGMRTADAMRVIPDETLFPGRPCAIREGDWVDTAPPRPLGDALPSLPDLSDPATLGCLLHLVRTAWHAPRALVRLSSDGRSSTASLRAATGPRGCPTTAARPRHTHSSTH